MKLRYVMRSLPATEDVINEGKYVTYDLGGKSTLTKTASEIALRAKRMLKK